MNRMDLFKTGEVYPPAEHEERIERYKENKELFKGNHYDVLNRANINRNSKYYISVNLAGIISKKSADFLIGDGIQVSAGKGDNSKEQEALERIYEQNDLDIRLYESALSNSYRGDSFFKARYGQEHDGELSPDVDPFRVIIESVPAQYVFPEESKNDPKEIKAYHVAVPIRIDESKPSTYADTWKLELESHYAGRIEYRSFYMKGIRMDVEGNPESFKIGDEIEEESYYEETGIPAHLIVHVPNYTTDDTYKGIDDLTELKPLFDELNNRFSQVSTIMDKHSDPAMAIPPGIMEMDEHGRPYFNVSQTKVFEVDDNDIIPQYITWNGQLQEAYEEIDILTSQILTVAELPEVALGVSGTGTSGGSGYSIKWRMNSLLSKVKRKRKYYEKGLKRIFLVAQLIERDRGIADYEITSPKFIFSDGLPKDDMEETNIAIQRTGGAVIQSQKSAIMEYRGLNEEQADVEIERIEDEQEKQKEMEKTGEPSFFNDVMEDIDQEEIEHKRQEDLGDSGDSEDGLNGAQADNRFKSG